MSKTKAAKPELADWSVTLLPAGTGISAGEVIPHSRWKRTRTEHGWGYTFYGEQGVIAEFTPGTIARVAKVPGERKPVYIPTPDGLTASQVRELQGALRAAAAAEPWLEKVILLPPGAKVRCDHSRHAGGHKPSTLAPGACFCGIRRCSICPDVVACVPPEDDPGPIETGRP